MPQNTAPEVIRDAADLLRAAVAHQEAGREPEAVALLDRLLAIDPRHAEGLTRRGWMLCRLGRLDQAIADHRLAIEIVPGYASAWSNLGVALQAKGEHEEALGALQRAVALDPVQPHPLVNLGIEWQARGMVSQSAACCRSAVAIDPALVEPWANLGVSLQEAGDVSGALAASRRALALRSSHRAALSNRLMTAQYATVPVGRLRREAALAGERLGTAAAPARRAGALQGRRIRVGYLSGDFRAHPVGWLSARALRAHDRERFEVHCYADQVADDEVSALIREGVEHWHPVRSLDDGRLHDLVRAHGIDVLVDLAGHTEGNRLSVFARRAAPVQLAWLGYAASTGVAAMDGMLVGEDMAPTGADDAFVEPLVRLPRIAFTYTPPSYAPPPARRDGSLTLGSFNNPAKIGPDVVATWARALAAVPGSRLVLKSRTLADPAAAERVRRRFAIAGVDPARIELRGPSPHREMLAEYADIDIALDPFPFCGGLTTCEALWMGVPVVTLPWLRPLSRQGAALLAVAGLPDLVARTPADYVGKVRALAGDAPRRAALRTQLRERLRASPLFDGGSLARALEDRFTEMLEAA